MSAVNQKSGRTAACSPLAIAMRYHPGDSRRLFRCFSHTSLGSPWISFSVFSIQCSGRQQAYGSKIVAHGSAPKRADIVVFECLPMDAKGAMSGWIGTERHFLALK